MIQVKGIRAAWLAAEIMARHTGRQPQPERGERDTYWVSETYLPPVGEQEVLDRLPRGTLLRCHGCSHQRPKEPRTPEPVRLTPRVRSRLKHLLADQQTGFQNGS